MEIEGEAKMEVSVKCSECGALLDADFATSRSRYGNVETTIEVEPCEKCMEAARQEAREAAGAA